MHYFRLSLKSKVHMLKILEDLDRQSAPSPKFPDIGFLLQSGALLFRSLGGECSGKFISYKVSLHPIVHSSPNSLVRTKAKEREVQTHLWKNKEGHCCPFLLLATFGARVPLDDEGKVLLRNHGHITCTEIGLMSVIQVW